MSLGGFEIIRSLGKGSFGEVFLALAGTPGGFQKQVAIKRLREAVTDDLELVERFAIEARICGYLHHPNIIHVYNFQDSPDGYLLIMEYLEGCDLRQLLNAFRRDRRVMPLALALELAVQLCEGLYFAHVARGADGVPLGLVHRDIKPSNLMVTRDGILKIMDFGVARADFARTRSGYLSVKGTLQYMAPEQAAGGRIDASVDQFAVGLILAEMILGYPLYQAELENQLYFLVGTAAVEAPLAVMRSHQPALADILARMLALSPAARFPDLKAVASVLRVERATLAEVVAPADVVEGVLRNERVGAQFGVRPDWPLVTTARKQAQDRLRALAKGLGAPDAFANSEEDDPSLDLQSMTREESLQAAEPSSNVAPLAQELLDRPTEDPRHSLEDESDPDGATELAQGTELAQATGLTQLSGVQHGAVPSKPAALRTGLVGNEPASPREKSKGGVPQGVTTPSEPADLEGVTEPLIALPAQADAEPGSQLLTEPLINLPPLLGKPDDGNAGALRFSASGGRTVPVVWAPPVNLTVRATGNSSPIGRDTPSLEDRAAQKGMPPPLPVEEENFTPPTARPIYRQGGFWGGLALACFLGLVGWQLGLGGTVEPEAVPNPVADIASAGAQPPVLPADSAAGTSQKGGASVRSTSRSAGVDAAQAPTRTRAKESEPVSKKEPAGSTLGRVSAVASPVVTKPVATPSPLTERKRSPSAPTAPAAAPAASEPASSEVEQPPNFRFRVLPATAQVTTSTGRVLSCWSGCVLPAGPHQVRIEHPDGRVVSWSFEVESAMLSCLFNFDKDTGPWCK